MIKSERNKLLINLMLLIAFLALISSGYFVYKYYILNKTHYIRLSEKSKIDYKVCLKKNNFFENECIDKNNQYVASLIDYIPISLNYDLSFLGEDVDFKYSYNIYAELNVIDKNNKKVLFTKRETLHQSDIINAVNDATIKYDTNVNYDKYNDILNSFVTIYDLDETINTLTVNLGVNISSDGNTSMKNINKYPAISLSIPLTRKTINIDINSTQNVSDTNVLIKKAENNIVNIISASICLFISLIIIIYVIYYYMSTRTVLEIYQSRIKKITSMYDSYIQRISGNYPIGASQICKVVSFNDMLEIKDSSDKPLLMLENEAKTGSFFIIPVGEGVIYTYALRVEDIMAEKDGTVAPDYGIEDIGTKEEAKRPKKYTKEKIKEDIEKTISLNIVDDKNAIKGTENSDEDLYDQLEKTATFKAVKDIYYFPEKKTKAKRKVSKKKGTKNK